MRARGPVQQAGLALRPEPRDPAMGTLTRDPELFRDMGDGATMTDHSLNEQTTAMQIQSGVSVEHEDLRAVVKTSDISTKPGGPHLSQDPTVTNVLAEYS